MTSATDQREYDNPFCTRRVRPGALAYRFPDGASTETLIARLQAARWRGAIVGPHGSGKSTLLATLAPAIESLGRQVVRIDLHDGARCVPAHAFTLARHPSSLLLIDGYEQLSRWSRWRVGRHCRRVGCGLLVTAHHAIGWPVIYQTATDEHTVQQLVGELLSSEPAAVSAGEISTAFAQHNGNVRETLFALYDLYELRKGSLPR